MTETPADKYLSNIRRCHTCDCPVAKDFHWEALKCEECGGGGCQHEIELVDDYGYTHQRLLCQECKRDRQEQGYIDLGEKQ